MKKKDLFKFTWINEKKKDILNTVTDLPIYFLPLILALVALLGAIFLLVIRIFPSLI